jgi:hypothetical protein
LAPPCSSWVAVGASQQGTGASTATANAAVTATPSASSGTLSVAAAGTAYLADVAPANTAVAALATQANGWTSSTTDAEAEADAQPTISAPNALETQLEGTNWPTVAKGDVETLTTDVGQLNASLETLSTLNFLDEGTWLQSFTSAANALGVAAGEVRHDLGLPPAS